jgi:ubiquinol-cytochrome c reductase cytochrome c1 subunit
MRPGGVNYIYNILTGYSFKPPYGMDVPKGKAFNPYFDHMIIGMTKQLNDGKTLIIQRLIYRPY